MVQRGRTPDRRLLPHYAGGYFGDCEMGKRFFALPINHRDNVSGATDGSAVEAHVVMQPRPSSTGFATNASPSAQGE